MCRRCRRKLVCAEVTQCSWSCTIVPVHQHLFHFRTVIISPLTHLVADLLAVNAMRTNNRAANAVHQFKTGKRRLEKIWPAKKTAIKCSAGRSGVRGTESVLSTRPPWLL